MSAAPSLRAALLLLGAALVSGCVPLRSEFRGFDHLGPDEVALVGKVVLDPPIGPGEQAPEPPTAAYRTHNVMYVDVAAEVHELDDTVTFSLGANTIQATFGETFRVVVNKDERFFNGGYIVMKQLPPVEVTALPLGGESPIEAGDRAIYIGTVLYHRDRFNKCVTIEIVDDYDAEAAAFAKLYGDSPKLEKRLLREVPGAPGRTEPSKRGGPDDPCR